MTYLLPRPSQDSQQQKCQIKRLEKGEKKTCTETFDYFMTSAELFAHSLLRFLICNCICNRLISLSHKLFMKNG